MKNFISTLAGIAIGIVFLVILMFLADQKEQEGRPSRAYVEACRAQHGEAVVAVDGVICIDTKTFRTVVLP